MPSSISSLSSESSLFSISSLSSESSSESKSSLSSESSSESKSSVSSESSSESKSSVSSESSSSFNVQALGLSGITGGNTFLKVIGTKESKVASSTLLQITNVYSKPAFDNANNWEAIVILYQHTNGNKKVVTHKLHGNQWVGKFKVSTFTDTGDWQKKRIVIRNKDGNLLSLYRETIGIDEDITITA